MIDNYILRLVFAGIICGIITSIVAGKSGGSTVIRVICGFFLTVTAVSSLLNLKVTDIEDYFENIHLDAQTYVEAGTALADSETALFIKDQMETYILDKASAMGVQIQVEIEMSEDPKNLPDSVAITGSVSPYNRKLLKNMINGDLGIPEEKQIWK